MRPNGIYSSKTSPAGSSNQALKNRNLGVARVVMLRAGVPGPCFFLVPGSGGRIEGFADLANLIEVPVPVYGIQARGLEPGTQPDQDINELVTHYLEQVRALQPNGPYMLAGHSFGGLVVYEMSQRLVAEGESVGCLMLLDVTTPRSSWPLSFQVANFGSRMMDIFKRATTQSPVQFWSYYTRRLRLRIQGLENLPTDLKFGSDDARVLLANDSLLRKWRPHYYPGRVILVCAATTHNLPELWKDKVKELSVHSSTGDHITLVQPPHVKYIAEVASHYISEAMQPNPAIAE